MKTADLETLRDSLRGLVIPPQRVRDIIEGHIRANNVVLRQALIINRLNEQVAQLTGLLTDINVKAERGIAISAAQQDINEKMGPSG